VVPLFVLGFLASAALRGAPAVIPPEVLGWIANVQVAALGAALFGMGAGRAPRLAGQEERLAGGRRRDKRTVFITGITLAGGPALRAGILTCEATPALGPRADNSTSTYDR